MPERCVPRLDPYHVLLMSQVVLLAADVWHSHGIIVRVPHHHGPAHRGLSRRPDLRVWLGKLIVLALLMQQEGDAQATAWMPAFGLDWADFAALGPLQL